jgi:hypothetical protein
VNGGRWAVHGGKGGPPPPSSEVGVPFSEVGVPLGEIELPFSDPSAPSSEGLPRRKGSPTSLSGRGTALRRRLTVDG